MKTAPVSVLALAGMLCLLCQSADGMESLSVDGNSYEVFFMCLDDAGDFCNKNGLDSDQFLFDGGDFGLKSFEDEFLGMGGSGSYSEQGLSFRAEYEVIDDQLDKYEFAVSGLSIAEEFIAGAMDITYSKWEIFDYDEEDQAAAFFLGIKR